MRWQIMSQECADVPKDMTAAQQRRQLAERIEALRTQLAWLAGAVALMVALMIWGFVGG